MINFFTFIKEAENTNDPLTQTRDSEVNEISESRIINESPTNSRKDATPEPPKLIGDSFKLGKFVYESETDSEKTRITKDALMSLIALSIDNIASKSIFSYNIADKVDLDLLIKTSGVKVIPENLEAIFNKILPSIEEVIPINSDHVVKLMCNDESKFRSSTSQLITDLHDRVDSKIFLSDKINLTTIARDILLTKAKIDKTNIDKINIYEIDAISKLLDDSEFMKNLAMEVRSNVIKLEALKLVLIHSGNNLFNSINSEDDIDRLNILSSYNKMLDLYYQDGLTSELISQIDRVNKQELTELEIENIIGSEVAGTELDPVILNYRKELESKLNSVTSMLEDTRSTDREVVTDIESVNQISYPTNKINSEVTNIESVDQVNYPTNKINIEVTESNNIKVEPENVTDKVKIGYNSDLNQEMLSTSRINLSSTISSSAIDVEDTLSNIEPKDVTIRSNPNSPSMTSMTLTNTSIADSIFKNYVTYSLLIPNNTSKLSLAYITNSIYDRLGKYKDALNDVSKLPEIIWNQTKVTANRLAVNLIDKTISGVDNLLYSTVSNIGNSIQVTVKNTIESAFNSVENLVDSVISFGSRGLTRASKATDIQYPSPTASSLTGTLASVSGGDQLDLSIDSQSIKTKINTNYWKYGVRRALLSDAQNCYELRNSMYWDIYVTGYGDEENSSTSTSTIFNKIPAFPFPYAIQSFDLTSATASTQGISTLGSDVSIPGVYSGCNYSQLSITINETNSMQIDTYLRSYFNAIYHPIRVNPNGGDEDDVNNLINYGKLDPQVPSTCMLPLRYQYTEFTVFFFRSDLNKIRYIKLRCIPTFSGFNYNGMGSGNNPETKTINFSVVGHDESDYTWASNLITNNGNSTIDSLSQSIARIKRLSNLSMMSISSLNGSLNSTISSRPDMSRIGQVKDTAFSVVSNTMSQIALGNSII